MQICFLIIADRDTVCAGRSELVAVRKDGTEFPMLLSLNLVKINDKVFVSAFVRDISGQREVRILVLPPWHQGSPARRA